ncbi:hypothetical protein LSAT2_030244, partial [Lamellibrachia satsuma]
MKWFAVLVVCLVVGTSAAIHGPRRISNTTQCEAVGGSCSASADCDLSSNVFVGSCDNTSFGCCISKDALCAARNGECMSSAECDAKSDYRATRMACSNGVCCVPRRSSRRNGGNGTRSGQRNGGKNGGGRGWGPQGRRPTAPYGLRMISNTTQCEAVGGSCSASADCDLSSNVFVGSCDNTSFGCCVSKDEFCAARNGECMSAAECDAKPDYRATRMGCSDGVCCVPRRLSRRNDGNGTRPGRRNGGKNGGDMGSGPYGRRPAAPYRLRRISNTTQCEAVGGSCSASADCDLSSNVFVGSCDNTSFGCCVSKADVCAARNGECMSAAECDAKSDYRATRMACSNGVCCVPRRSSLRNGGNGTRSGQRNGGKNGRGIGLGPQGRRPAAPYGLRMISNTTQCEAVGGSCSASADCDLSSNVFVGSCDNTSFGCCISKEELCAARNGECMSAAECEAKSDYRATRMGCSNGVCCVPRRSSLRNDGNGTRPDQRNGGNMGSGPYGRRPAAPYGLRKISNTTQCEAVGGSCSASADCDLSSNIFVGSCDNTSFGCCVSKDELCAARNGECMSAADCDAKSGNRANRKACSDG